MSPQHSDRFGVGLGLALTSSVFFSLAGVFAAAVFAAGWTPLGAVFVRVSVGSLVLLVPAAVALRGRFGLMLQNWKMLLGYGVLAVALTQVSYFHAVQYLQVAQALLIQYLAPVLLVVWLWVRRGERPGLRIILGSVVAVVGLVLVLEVLDAGLSLDPRGIAWAVAALVGNAAYFVFASNTGSSLPGPALALGGTVVGAVVFGLLGLLGVLPFRITMEAATLASAQVPWWLMVLLLGVVVSALSYLAGIYSARMLGTRLASFIGLSEVLFASIFSVLLVGQRLNPGQVLGGVLVLAGVVLVKLGESRVGAPPMRPTAVKVAA